MALSLCCRFAPPCWTDERGARKADQATHVERDSPRAPATYCRSRTIDDDEANDRHYAKPRDAIEEVRSS
jgi:hypothetical protein